MHDMNSTFVTLTLKPQTFFPKAVKVQCVHFCAPPSCDDRTTKRRNFSHRVSFVELLGSHENKISPDEEEDSKAHVLSTHEAESSYTESKLS
jgi:hypothetical protein